MHDEKHVQCGRCKRRKEHLLFKGSFHDSRLLLSRREVPRGIRQAGVVRQMGASGTLQKWDRTADLGRITVPTLMIGATHDTMDPKHMEMMAGAVKHGRFLLCPNGSHLAEYDDSRAYFTGLLKFIDDVSTARF